MEFKQISTKAIECIDCGCLMPDTLQDRQVHTCTPTGLLQVEELE